MWRANFYPNYIVTFSLPETRMNDFPTSNFQPEQNKVKGSLSAKSALKLQKALTWMWLFSKKNYGYGKNIKKPFAFRLNFFTLTLSDAQMHSDDWIKIHMLEPMLKWMKRCGCKNYLWKAETQENGNIHFHITTNHFIHYLKFREKWNHIQYKAGYLERRQRNGKDLDPNSTDVHAVKQEGKFVRYMTNYMKKDICERDEYKFRKPLTFVERGLEFEMAMMSIGECGIPAIRRQVEGKLWACNRELLDIKVSIKSDDDDFGEMLMQHQSDFNAEWRKHDFCDTWRHKLLSMHDKLHPKLCDKFAEEYKVFHGELCRIKKINTRRKVIPETGKQLPEELKPVMVTPVAIAEQSKTKKREDVQLTIEL